MARYPRTITRRGVISAAASAAILPAAASAAGTPAWTKAAYEQAMHEFGRPVSLTDAQFDAIQKRKPAAIKRIDAYLKDHFGAADPAVMAAFEAVPREYYHYEYPEHRATPGDAYEDNPKPWALGWGSALSDYLGQAYMTQVCKPAPGEITLEIGTGSGFQSSPAVPHRQDRLLDRDHRAAWQSRRQHFRAAGLRQRPYQGRRRLLWLAGSAGRLRHHYRHLRRDLRAARLFKQLKPGGRMIIPIGQPFKRGQVLYAIPRMPRGRSTPAAISACSLFR